MNVVRRRVRLHRAMVYSKVIRVEEPTSTLQWNMSAMIRVSKTPTKLTCRCDLFVIIVISIGLFSIEQTGITWYLFHVEYKFSECHAKIIQWTYPGNNKHKSQSKRWIFRSKHRWKWNFSRVLMTLVSVFIPSPYLLGHTVRANQEV